MEHTAQRDAVHPHCSISALIDASILWLTQDRVDNMITHLASLSDKKLIISFAPYTPAYALLKRIGELFPGPSKVCSSWCGL